MKPYLGSRTSVFSVLATLVILLDNSSCVAFSYNTGTQRSRPDLLQRKPAAFNPIIHHNLDRKKSTSFNMVNPLHINAACALMGSSYIGLQFDKLVPSSGIVGTLVVSAILSNSFSWVPTHHPFYDLCWSHVLPASLVMLLLAYKANQEGSFEQSTAESNSSVTSSIARMSIPFLWASFGSLLGCFTSFKCSQSLGWLSLENARAAAACLSASYVGGSINYFATGRMINASSDLLGSLATADLFVMAIYFSFLSVSLGWKWLRSMFYFLPKATTDFTLATEEVSKDQLKAPSQKAFAAPKKFLGMSLVTAFALCTVQLSQRIEKALNPWIPGTASAVIAIVTPFVNSRINRKKWWLPLSDSVSTFGDFLFLCFFAAIGMGSDLKGVVEMGPACFCFAALALLIHLIVALLGSSIGAKFLKVDLEDVWIASNAAIGGPATAAAFCSRLKDSSNLREKALAGTVYGCGKLSSSGIS